MIRIHELRKSFGTTPILRGVSLVVARGEVCALVGPSGGGKSTLLRTINGLETFDEGTLEVDGVLLGAQPGQDRDQALRSIRQRVGMVFQQFHLFPHLSVLENVIEAPIHVLRQPRTEAIKTAERLLEQVGMLHRIHAKPTALSGGQQQRVAIARALAMNPQVMLFDEPTSALDPEMTAEVVQVMRDLAQKGQTMLIVTHDISVAQRVAHRTLTLAKGEIVASSRAEPR